MKKRTPKEFYELVTRINPNIECLQDYQGNKVKILFRCLVCGNEWYTTPDRIIQGYGCPKCGILKQKQSRFKKTQEKLDAILQDKFTMLNPYQGDDIFYEFKCNSCGRVQRHRASVILRNKKLECCCSSNKPKHYDQDSFIQEANKVHNNKYNYDKLKFTTTNSYGIITCPIHGDFKQNLKHHLRGSGCPECAKDSKRSNTLEFIEKAKKVHGDKYDYSKVEYINNMTPIVIICPIHGEFQQVPSKHLSGHGCPICRQSKGEEKISKFLNTCNIIFQREYSINIKSVVNSSNTIRVDFYLPDYNTIIEYNGKQHYIPVEHFGGELQLERQKIRDQELRDYCQLKHLNLIEVKYDIENIEEYLNEKFRKYGII